MTTEGLEGTISGLFGARQPLPRLTESVVISGESSVLTASIDGMLSESHQAELTATDYPVEGEGGRVDHAIRKPLKLTLEGWVSSWRPFSAGSTPTEVWAEILAFMDRREIVSVTTGLATYDQMLITKASAPVDRTTGTALRFTMELVEVLRGRLVETPGPSATTGPAADRIDSLDLGNVELSFVSDDEAAYFRSEMEYLGLKEGSEDRFTVVEAPPRLKKIEVDPRSSNQSMNLQLPGVRYRLRLAWQETTESWHLSIHGSDDSPIALSRRIAPRNRIVNSRNFLGEMAACQRSGNQGSPFDRNCWNTHDLLYLSPGEVEKVDWLL